MTVRVILDNTTHEPSLPTEAQFQEWIDCILSTVEDKLDESVDNVTISIVDLEKSAALNEAFRGKSGPTNVLSFTYDPIPGFPEESLGDLAICADIMKEEAQQQDTPIIAHWAHLTIHGILHLLGYDHLTDDEAATMEALEINALKKLGFENPYV